MADPTSFSPVGLALSSIAPLYKSISGFFQQRKGNKLLDSLKRPNYGTPGEIYKNLDLARNQFMDTRLPGQSVAENKLQANTAQAINQAQMYGRSPSDIMAAIVGANANENNAYNDLATQASQRQLQDLQNYQGALNTSADYKDKEFAYNKWMPYMADRQYGENLVGAGNKNLYGGLSDLAAGGVMTGASTAGDKALGNLYKKLFGNQGNKTRNYGTSDYGVSAENLTGDQETRFWGGPTNPYMWK